MRLISYIILLFFIYSVIGWLLETFLMLFKTKKFNNCGFLIGPYCPMYGLAAIIMILTLNNYVDNPILVFIYSVIICSTIEYITSVILEKIIKIRWWDYSEIPFNFNGRTCLPVSIIFGILSLITMYFINPTIVMFINYLPHIVANALTIIIIVIMAADLFLSLSIIKNNNTNVESYANKITEISKSRIKKFVNLFRKNGC